jgi:hypothetical protein
MNEIFEVPPIEAVKALLETRGKFSKTLEIAAVAFERVIREAAFDPKMRQIRVDEIVGG